MAEVALPTVREVLRCSGYNTVELTPENATLVDLLLVYAQSYSMDQPLPPELPKSPVALLFTSVDRACVMTVQRLSLWRVNTQYTDKVIIK